MSIIKWAFWPDTHEPWHDVTAVSIASDIVKCFKPHGICFVGDFHDCYNASRFSKHPDKMFSSLDDEIESGIDLRNHIVNNSRTKNVIFIEGNHEHRIQKYIWDNAGLISNYITPKTILKIPKTWKYVPYGQSGYVQINQLIVTHGSRHNKNVASSMLDFFKCSVLFAHTHRYQVACSRQFLGGPIFSYNIGWLGNPKTAGEYCTVPPDWVHMVTLAWFSNKHFQIQPIFINKKGIFDGKIFTSR